MRAAKAKGLGLGLNIAKRIIELNGGSMELKSTQGKGTKVTATLPMASELRVKQIPHNPG